jgi:hypothetical protein
MSCNSDCAGQGTGQVEEQSPKERPNSQAEDCVALAPRLRSGGTLMMTALLFGAWSRSNPEVADRHTSDDVRGRRIVRQHSEEVTVRLTGISLDSHSDP